MQLKELFSPADFVVDFEPADKWDAIAKLMQHLTATYSLDAAASEEFSERVLERERSMSTGMEDGIAIPHAAVEGLDQVLACIGIVSREDGLAFDSIDGQGAHLVVLLLIPKQQKLLHIRTLADIARVLGKPEVRSALIAADSAHAAWNVLVEDEARVG